MLGRHHPLVRRVRALRRDPDRRRSERVLVAEGVHLAEACLDSAAAIEVAMVGPRLAEREDGRRLLERLTAAGIPLEEVADSVLEGLGDARSPQPVLVVARRPPTDPERALARAEPPALALVAWGVQEPGNLGALVRTAEAAGASGLLAVSPSADLFHPRTVRASAGSILRLPVATLEPDELVQLLAAREVSLVAADPRGETDYREVDLRGAVAVAVGAEGPGLPREIRERAVARVRIPLDPAVESLSVNAAAALLLFEARRRREG